MSEASVRALLMDLGTEVARRASNWHAKVRATTPRAGFWSDDVEEMKTKVPGMLLELTDGTFGYVPYKEPVRNTKTGVKCRVHIFGLEGTTYKGKEWFSTKVSGAYGGVFPGRNAALKQDITGAAISVDGVNMTPVAPDFAHGGANDSFALVSVGGDDGDGEGVGDCLISHFIDQLFEQKGVLPIPALSDPGRGEHADRDVFREGRMMRVDEASPGLFPATTMGKLMGTLYGLGCDDPLTVGDAAFWIGGLCLLASTFCV